MKLALGTVQFGLDYGVANDAGRLSLAEAKGILSLASTSGIAVLDTAIAYGTSEEVLGKIGVDQFRIVTKLPSLPFADEDEVVIWIRDQVEASLARLGQKQIYGLLLHRPHDLLGSESKLLIRTLIDLKEAGFIQKIGISIYSPDGLDEIFKRAPIDLVQAPLNVVDRRMETSGWLDRLKADGVEIHARSAFLQGLLLMDRSKIPQKFSRWSMLWDAWHERLRNAGMSPLVACLSYPLSFEQVDHVIVGVDTAAQLTEIIQAANHAEADLDTLFMTSTDTNLTNPSNWNHL